MAVPCSCAIGCLLASYAASTHEQAVESATAECIAEGLRSLGNLSSITALDCTSVCEALQMPASFQAALVGCSQLKRLSLPCAYTGDSTRRNVAKVLLTLTKLQHLDLAESFIGDEGMKEIGLTLQALTSLRSLDLSMCNLGEEGIRLLQPGLHTSLTSLKLDSNYVRTPARLCSTYARHCCVLLCG